MPCKDHMPQLFLKILWKITTRGQCNKVHKLCFLLPASTIMSTGMSSNSGGDAWMSMWSLWLTEGCVPWAHNTQQQTSASSHEDTMPGSARMHQSTSQVVLISTSATYACARTECSPGTWLSLPWFSLSIPTLLAKSLCPDSPSASLPFSLLDPSFLFSNYSQWTKKSKMEKKFFLLTFAPAWKA